MDQYQGDGEGWGQEEASYYHSRARRNFLRVSGHGAQ